MLVISKNAAELSFAPGVITRPEVLCVPSVVVAFVTFGPANVTAILAVAVAPLKPLMALVDDSSTLKLPPASEPVVGVNFSPAAPCAT